MPNPLLLKLENLVRLSSLERDVLERLTRDAVDVGPGQDLVREGDALGSVFIVLQGYACRYKLLPDARRQITAYLIPGDFSGLHLLFPDRMDYSVGTLSACTVAQVPHETMSALMKEHPGIAGAMRRAAFADEAVLNEWVVNIGRRTSYERLAHLFYELLIRHRAVGLAQEDGYDFPLTQVDLGDTMALSTVHVNRTLQALRSDGLIGLGRRRLDVLDVERLKSIGMFNPNYLYFDPDRRPTERSTASV